MKTSKFLTLNWADLFKGLATAVFSAVILFLADVLKVPGFELGALPWDTILKVALTAGLGYLAKNWLSTSDGKVAGVIG